MAKDIQVFCRSMSTWEGIAIDLELVRKSDYDALYKTAMVRESEAFLQGWAAEAEAARRYPLK